MQIPHYITFRAFAVLVVIRDVNLAARDRFCQPMLLRAESLFFILFLSPLSLHDRRVSVLGLCALLSLPNNQRPIAVDAFCNKYMPAFLMLFGGLKRAYEHKAKNQAEEGMCVCVTFCSGCVVHVVSWGLWYVNHRPKWYSGRVSWVGTVGIWTINLHHLILVIRTKFKMIIYFVDWAAYNPTARFTRNTWDYRLVHKTIAFNL